MYQNIPRAEAPLLVIKISTKTSPQRWRFSFALNRKETKRNTCLWAFSIYQKIPEIPVGLQMEHDFSVRSTGKFPETSEFLEKVVPFSRWKLPNGNLCSIYRFLVFITSSMPFAVFQAARRLSCFNKNGGWSGSVFWKLFANKLLGLLRVLYLPRYSARSGKFIAARMCRM